MLDRIAFGLVIERGPDEALGILLTGVYENKRTIQIEEPFVLRADITCLDLVFIEVVIWHLHQGFVHPILSPKGVIN